MPLFTNDHGVTWFELPALAPYMVPAPDGSPPRREQRHVLAVSAVGAATEDLFRLGW